jgi:hypothetical protein
MPINLVWPKPYKYLIDSRLVHPGQRWVWHTKPRFIVPAWEDARPGTAQRYRRLRYGRGNQHDWRLNTSASTIRTRFGPAISIPMTDGAELEGDHILWLASGVTPNLRHDSNTGTVTITSSVSITNDTAWHTLVATWRPRRLKLYVDGIPRANSTAANTNTSDAFGIYRWGWGISTNQDFNGDIVLILCCGACWTGHMVRRWHADPFGFLRPWNEVPALMGSAPPATPPSTGAGVITFLMG